MAPLTKKQRASSSKDKKVRLRHACAPSELVEVNKNLTEAQRAQIEATPFKWVVNMPDNFQISSLLLSELATRWDEQYEGFRVRGSVVRFRPIDVCFALGLPIVGEELEADEHGESNTLSLFGEDDVTIDSIVDKLVECDEDDVLNFCRLYILLSFGEFYFPQSEKRIYCGYIKYLDNLQSLHMYKWGQAVHKFVVASLKKVCSVVNEGKNVCETHLRGCAAVLQIWAFNHLPLGETPDMPHRFPFPHFLNWPIVRHKIRIIQDAFRRNVVIENLTATGEELQFDVVRDALEDAEHQYVRVSEYRRLVVEHQHSQERIFILEADVKMLKDQLRSRTEPHDASPLIPSPHTDVAVEVGDEVAYASPLIPSPHTDVAFEVGDEVAYASPLILSPHTDIVDEVVDALLSTPTARHGEDGNADADALVSTPKGRHGEDGEGGDGEGEGGDADGDEEGNEHGGDVEGEGRDADGDQQGNEDGGDGDGDEEGNDDGEAGDKSNIMTRVKQNPRPRVQSVASKSPFMHTYMTRKKRTAMQRATRQTTKNA